MLKNCNNENVIRFIDTICTEEYIFLVTEFCNGGNLEEYLNSRTRLA